MLEAEDQTASTGWTQLPFKYAGGMVYLTNLTDEEVEIPNGTIVMTETKPPVRFKTLREVTVTSGKNSTTAVPVQAANPGSQGNLEAEKIQTIEGALGLQVSVINKEPTLGGADEEALQPHSGRLFQSQNEDVKISRRKCLERIRVQTTG